MLRRVGTNTEDVVVLLVEDDPAIVDAFEPYAIRRAWQLRWARTVGEARRLAATQRPSIVLLDRGLPGIAGDAFASDLVAANVPFIMLTARSAEAERLSGFDLGADDYVTKPFSSAELLRRIDVVLRRRGLPRIVIDETIEIDIERRAVSVASKDVMLTASEYTLLAVLAARPGRVYAREELLELLQLDLTTSERALDSHVKNLRRKLRTAGADERILQTVIGKGYALRGKS